MKMGLLLKTVGIFFIGGVFFCQLLSRSSPAPLLIPDPYSIDQEKQVKTKDVTLPKKKFQRQRATPLSIEEAHKEIVDFCTHITTEQSFTLTKPDYDDLIKKIKELISKKSIDEKISSKNVNKIKKALENHVKNLRIIFYPQAQQQIAKVQQPQQRSLQPRSKQKKLKTIPKKSLQRKYEQAVSLTFASQKVLGLLKNNNASHNLNDKEIHELHKNIMRKLLTKTTPRNRILPSVIQKITDDELVLYKEAKTQLRPTPPKSRSTQSRLLRRRRSLPRSLNF